MRSTSRPTLFIIIYRPNNVQALGEISENKREGKKKKKKEGCFESWPAYASTGWAEKDRDVVLGACGAV